MGFMQAQMTEKTWWVEIDGDDGITAVPADEFSYSKEDLEKFTESGEFPQDIRECYEGRRIFAVSLVKGYGVRSSAPGYMDCTPWTVYGNKREAEKAYRQEKEECGD